MILALVAAIALGGVATAFSQESGQGTQGKAESGQVPKRKGHHGPLGFLSKLNLTNDQKHKVALILKDHRQEAKETMNNLRTARKNLFAAVNSQEYNEAAVRQAAKDVARWQEEMAVHRAKVMSEVRKVLTPEQISQIEAKKAGFGDKFEKRRQKHMERMDKWIEKHAAQE